MEPSSAVKVGWQINWMRRLQLISLVFAIGLLTSTNLHAKADPVSRLASPDKHCEIVVAGGTNGTWSYQVFFHGRPVLLPSPLGLRRSDADFSQGLRLVSASPKETRREQYTLQSGAVWQIDHEVNHRTLTFLNAQGATMLIDLAASNEGVAFRYRFSETNASVFVAEAELSGFRVPAAARGWMQPYHGASDYTPAYEDFYFPIVPGDPPPRSRGEPKGWAFPALFQIPHAGWMLLAESGTDAAYCACHLGADSTGGIYRIAFPLADETTKHRKFTVGPEPRSSLPWTLPWRVITLGKSAGDIALATLVTDLAPPAKLAATDWIKPGRASWAWWAYPDGPNSAERFAEFTDFARRMGWEYTLFDAGWWQPGLAKIATYALAKGVTPLAWLHAEDFYDPIRCARKLDEVAAAGVRGVKVDFWCSDRQETMAAMQALFAAAAERRLLVNLHGCTVPRGWQRTWPHFMTAEAVLGTESYFYESRYPEKAAELNTVLPFTRNAVGPMDYTPVAGTIKKYHRLTTPAHELATALVFSSGLVHYADKPEFFESLPPAVQQIFRDAPARWDETRCPVGEPGRLVVFARLHGDAWFIAGLNGTDKPQPVRLNLAVFKSFAKRLVVTEGDSPEGKVSAKMERNTARWRHEIPPRGGFILRLDR